MPPNGDKTRKKLIEVASRLFCERGFDGVSTRDIVSAAGTTLPTISHHFGSKDGLYRAVLDDIGAQMEERLSAASAPALAMLAAQERASRRQHLEALQDLLGALTRAILQSPTEWGALIGLEERLHSGGMTPIAGVLEKHMLRPIAQLIAAIRGLSPSSNEVKLQTIALLGRVLIFRTRRTIALQILDWPDLTSSRIEIIVDMLRREIGAIFDDGRTTEMGQHR